MARRSWFIPGGGYFCTCNWFLGLGDFLVEAYLFLLLVLSALIATGMIADVPSEPGEEPLTGGAAWAAAAFLGALLAVEKLLTIHHCRRFVHDLIPKT